MGSNNIMQTNFNGLLIYSTLSALYTLTKPGLCLSFRVAKNGASQWH
jgi:hypothetical protein